jgi:hypothetical protein
MRLDNPFPIGDCSPRLRNAILGEFQGRCPTLQEVFSIPAKQWLKVPGVGQTLLTELEAIMQNRLEQTKGQVSAQMTDAELIARLELLLHDLKRLSHEVQTRLDNVSKSRPRTGGSNH